MLYIKFRIQDPSKYTDFEKLFKHMVEVRQPGFKFVEEAPAVDWGKLSEEELDKAIEKWDATSNQSQQEAEKRYKQLIPDYAHLGIEKYLNYDQERFGWFGERDRLAILNYLEFGFEVDLNHLEQLDPARGIVEFSTGNYPFGGLERFLVVLTTFELIPFEAFNGFEVIEYRWLHDFEFEVTALPERTKAYLDQFKS